jgi:hypothetical protein
MTADGLLAKKGKLIGHNIEPAVDSGTFRSLSFVTPANAGVQCSAPLDPGLRRKDGLDPVPDHEGK